jgi:hypothetical protein
MASHLTPSSAPGKVLIALGCRKKKRWPIDRSSAGACPDGRSIAYAYGCVSRSSTVIAGRLILIGSRVACTGNQADQPIRPPAASWLARRCRLAAAKPKRKGSPSWQLGSSDLIQARRGEEQCHVKRARSKTMPPALLVNTMRCTCPTVPVPAATTAGGGVPSSLRPPMAPSSSHRYRCSKWSRTGKEEAS